MRQQNWINPTLKSVKNPIKLLKTFWTLKELFEFRARERVHNVDFWMKSFLRNIGTVIEEDGEEVLPTTMQPVNMDDFDSYLGPYVGNKVSLILQAKEFTTFGGF